MEKVAKIVELKNQTPIKDFYANCAKNNTVAVIPIEMGKHSGTLRLFYLDRNDKETGDELIFTVTVGFGTSGSGNPMAVAATHLLSALNIVTEFIGTNNCTEEEWNKMDEEDRGWHICDGIESYMKR